MMCEIDHGAETCDLWVQTTRKAIKSHKCSECYKEIQKGEKYQYHTSLYDGKFESYKLCNRCQKAADWLGKRYHTVLIGNIIHDVKYCVKEEMENAKDDARRISKLPYVGFEVLPTEKEIYRERLLNYFKK